MEWTFKGEHITVAREARGVSQEELSKRTGFSQTQISRWETGKVKPGQDSLTRICNALQTVPSFFFVNSGNSGKDGN